MTMPADASVHAEGALALHRLTDAEVPPAADMLARRFEGDPFVDWVVRSDDQHDEAMRRFFTVCLRLLTMPFGEVWATEDLEGVALWTPPGKWKVGAREEALFLWQAVRTFGLHKVPSRISAFNEIERHHPSELHYYLFFIGVDAARAGRGIGSAMMTAMLDRCDADGMPAYLEATRADLAPFYRRFGYAERPPIRLPHGGPAMYPMWREPQR
jgi:GNAT superfamily N-acetyltransferase